MEFSVPQFIEKESKVVGPFSFRQFIYIGIAGGVIVLLFMLRVPFFIFLPLGLIIAIFALVLVFLKIEGFPLPTIIKNLFIFLFRPRIYLWRRKIVLPKILKREEKVTIEQKEKGPVLKITERSHLNELLSFIETRGR